GKILHVCDKTARRKNRYHNRSQMSATHEQDDDHGRLEPSARWMLNRRLDHDGPRGQQHGIDGGEVVILAVERKQRCVTNQIAPAEKAVRLESRGKKQCQQAGDPNGRGERMNQKSLLEEVLKWSEHYIAVFGFDVAHQFEEGPMVLNVPEKVG